MPYIESLLQKKLVFEFRQVGLKWGVFEKVQKEDVTVEVGCVYIGTAADCREYVNQRRSKQALKEEEKRGTNPFIERFPRRDPLKDGVISMGD